MPTHRNPIMNRHIVAALLLVVFLVTSTPFMLLQGSGVANASFTSGFMLPVEYKSHILFYILIGVIAAWLGREMIVLLPLCSLIMLALGAATHLESMNLPSLRAYTAGAILLVAFSVSVMRHKVSMFLVVPLAFWTYYAGSAYCLEVPAGIQPIFYLIGIEISIGMLMAIGVALAITVGELLRAALNRLSRLRGFASLMSLF